MLFLVNEKDGLIEGKLGIGPETGEEANRIWNQIESEKMSMDDLINVYKFSHQALESGFNRQVRNLKFTSRGQNDSLLALSVLDGMPLHLTRETMQNYLNDPVIQLLKSQA